MKYLSGFIFILAVALTSSASQAYGGDGHRIFCQLAYELSAPETQRQLDAQAAKDDRYDDFSAMCSWADHIKSNDRWDAHKPHHYVNFDHGAAKLTATDCPPQGCILSAIQHHYQVLENDSDDWIALAFLAHYIGDLHQPMHVSFADDLGGNRAQLQFYDEPRNLHWVWDTGMLLRRGGNDPEAKAQQLRQGLTPLEPVQLTAPMALAWANESAAITRRIYSDYSSGQKLAEAYTDRYGPVLEERMQTGAKRLAAVLDALYHE